MQTTRRKSQHAELACDPGQSQLAAGPPETNAAAPALGVRFALKYALFAGVGFVVYGYPYAARGIVERGFERYLSAYASVVGAILCLFEPGLQIAGTHLFGRFGLHIAKNCDAIEANILLVGALLAFPGALKRRIVAAVVGVVLLAAMNVVRISSLYFVGVHAHGWFEFAHLELWPLLLIGFAAVEFLLLARWVQAPATGGVSEQGRSESVRVFDRLGQRVRVFLDSVRRKKWGDSSES